MTDAQAHALSNHPFVEMVEEDQPVYIAEQASFSFADAYQRRDLQTQRVSPEVVPTSCPWTNGSYYDCAFSDDLRWALDQLDNQGWVTGDKHYAFATTGSGVRAYIVDSGIWGTHVEFDSPSRVEVGANMMVDPDVTDTQQRNDEEPGVLADATAANNPCNGFNGDEYIGHGTAVASALGGTNTGVAKNVILVPVKVINCSRQGSMLAIARGLDWIISDMQAHPAGTRAVVSMSVYFDSSVQDTSNTRGTYTYGQEQCELYAVHSRDGE